MGTKLTDFLALLIFAVIIAIQIYPDKDPFKNGIIGLLFLLGTFLIDIKYKIK